MQEVLVVGGGIGGLTLALELRRRNIPCRVFEIETPQYQQWDWNRKARIEDFFAHVAAWHFDWLDIPATSPSGGWTK